MDRTSLLQLIEPLLSEGKQILLSQLNRLLPVDLTADELDTIFLTLDEEGINIVDDAIVLKEARPSVKAELTQKTTPDPMPGTPEEEELASNQRWYQREITKIPRLTEEEERQMGLLAVAGDAKAADTLVQTNLRLVVSVAKRYIKSGVNLMDLIQAGNEGLIDASTRFNPDKGARFASFSRWWIRQAIVRAISASWQAIRIPKNLSRECHRVVLARQAFKRDAGRSPSAKEVAEATGFALEHVEFLDSLIQTPLSLDAPIPGMDGVLLETTIPDDKAAEPLQESVRQSVREVLAEVFEKLELTQRRVLALRFGIPDQVAKSVDEVARMTGMSRDKVRQIEKQAIRKLRSIAVELKLEKFLKSHLPSDTDDDDE